MKQCGLDFGSIQLKRRDSDQNLEFPMKWKKSEDFGPLKNIGKKQKSTETDVHVSQKRITEKG